MSKLLNCSNSGSNCWTNKSNEKKSGNSRLEDRIKLLFKCTILLLNLWILNKNDCGRQKVECEIRIKDEVIIWNL